MTQKKKKHSLSDALGPLSTKEEIISMLKKRPKAWSRFSNFKPDQQDEVLQFMMGNRGLKILYNNFFLNIFNPQDNPRRLESLLSALLGTKIKIKATLPREGIQLAEKGSFVIMDILVELEDGTLFNLEIQKVGYAFPGQRTSCYISDLIMRQYNRLHGTSDKDHPFNYREMKPVHILVLMEESSSNFSKVAPHYVHTKQITYSSGADVTDLEKVTYISLDTFRDVVQNNIDSDLHAWLTFLCSDDPDAILRLIDAYPEFIPIYQDIARFRSDPEEVVNMYSEALRELDHNTEVYMVEEARRELADLTKKLDDKNLELDDKNRKLDDATQKLDDATQKLDDTTQKLDDTTQELDVTKQQLDESESKVAFLQSLLRQNNIPFDE